MRIAFTMIGGPHWAGGLNYFVNMLSALSEVADRSIEPVLFVGTDESEASIEAVAAYLPSPPIRDPLWNRSGRIYHQRLLSAVALGRDHLAEEAFVASEIDLVFQHFALYGRLFAIPTLAWIPDFQHRHLPDTFSKFRYLRREFAHRLVTRSASKILVSSKTCAADCATYYPDTKGRISVLPFVPQVIQAPSPDEILAVRMKYGLPPKFIFLPNQFWKHKNHLIVVEALRQLKLSGMSIIVVATGALLDPRNMTYPQSVIDKVVDYGLSENFIHLGMVPKSHIYPLMRAAIAVMNPSLSEGWSTTVEEAKALGVPLVLSDLKVHREQDPPDCLYFDPLNIADLARAMRHAWEEFGASPRADKEQAIQSKTQLRRQEFARRFMTIAQDCV